MRLSLGHLLEHKSFIARLGFLLAVSALFLPGCKPNAASNAARPSAAEEPHVYGRINSKLAAEVVQMERREQQIKETVWAEEMLAQECGRVVESFWDTLNKTTNKLSVAAAFPVGQILLGAWNAVAQLSHGIELRQPVGVGPLLSQGQWQHWIGELERAGWQLAETEFRHIQFETDTSGRPSRSRFYVAAHLINLTHPERAIVEGNVLVTWGITGLGEPHSVKQIDASQLVVKSRRGELPFELILVDQTPASAHTYSIGPLLVYDLDGDGLSEILLPAKNLVYQRTGTDQYQPKLLFRNSPGPISAALIADFNGDGAADFLCEKGGGLFLFNGSPQGAFETPGRVAWPGTRELKYAMAFTCGDIDRDGDLDVFLGQYKLPYEGGQMPTPHYDANDGFPAYLLVNDGHGHFTDRTLESGLHQKRWRRSFSASFVDLNADGPLDLVVVSDFAGLDLYQNAGHGRFTDQTARWVRESRAFGMAHSLADFNADGRLDLLMIGMPSPTADRLEHLGLWRTDVPDDHSMRAKMTFGNRLYMSGGSGGLESSSANDSIARSGWSWGCSVFDFDNDSFPDVYIANGMESRESVHEYEGDYWLHDIYVADSNDNPAAYVYLQSKLTRVRGHGASHGGYERNRFYLNQEGASFLEIAHLFGVGLQLDSRNVVSDDLDGDGRLDLLVTSFEPWPDPKQTLRVYRNRLQDRGNWIGFRFREEGRGSSPVGVQVKLNHQGRQAVRHIVTGDSHRAQHASTVHFGLGSAAEISNVEIRWADGRTLTLRNLAVNRYYSITPP